MMLNTLPPAPKKGDNQLCSHPVSSPHCPPGHTASPAPTVQPTSTSHQQLPVPLGLVTTAMRSLRAEPSPSESAMTPLHTTCLQQPRVPWHPQVPITTGFPKEPPAPQGDPQLPQFSRTPSLRGSPQHPQVPITIGSPAAPPALWVSSTTVCHISGGLRHHEVPHSTPKSPSPWCVT